MEKFFALAAVFFVIFSFFGLLKVLFRGIAILCVIAAIIFWYTGGRERLVEGVDSGQKIILQQMNGLVENERQILEDALRDPSSVVGSQKARIREITGKLLENPEISSNEDARKTLGILNNHFTK